MWLATQGCAAAPPYKFEVTAECRALVRPA
jgi:hypothetical protein